MSPRPKAPASLTPVLIGGMSSPALDAGQIEAVAVARKIQSRVILVTEIDAIKAGAWGDGVATAIAKHPAVRLPELAGDLLGGYKAAKTPTGPSEVKETSKRLSQQLASKNAQNPNQPLVRPEPVGQDLPADLKRTSSLALRARVVLRTAKEMGYEVRLQMFPSQTPTPTRASPIIRGQSPIVRGPNKPTVEFDPLIDIRQKALSDIERWTRSLEGMRRNLPNMPPPTVRSGYSSSATQPQRSGPTPAQKASCEREYNAAIAERMAMCARLSDLSRPLCLEGMGLAKKLARDRMSTCLAR